MDIRKWLITKLAGDRLVILNATVLYKYYPIFADIDKKPIVDNNIVIKHNIDTPFNIYDSKIFETTDNELKVKNEYLEAYNKVITEIQENNKEKVDADKLNEKVDADKLNEKVDADKFNEVAASKGEIIV